METRREELLNPTALDTPEKDSGKAENATQPTAPTKQERCRKPGEKRGRDERIAQLLAKVKELGKQLSERTRETEQQKQLLQTRDQELSQLRAERQKSEERQKGMPERIAKAVAEGRKLFGDFDSVIHGVPVDRQAFEVILASANGPELFYAAGLGMRLIALMRQIQNQAQEEQQRIAYYRQMHQQHFTGEQNGL